MDAMTCDTITCDNGLDTTTVDPTGPDQTGFDPTVTEPVTMSYDSDGDGFAETTIIDLDGDGIADAAVYDDGFYSEMIADTDGDGIIDTYVADTDGNGIIDVELVDVDGDGVVDYEAYGENPLSDQDLLSPIAPDVTVDGTDTTDLLTIDEIVDNGADAGDPFEVSVDDSVHGEPMAETEYHQVQPGPVDCLPTSVAMVLSEVTGEMVPAEEVVALANDMGVMTSTGMAAEDGVALLEQYGVEAEVTNGDMDLLRAELDSGTDVIIGLDSADLYADGGGPFDPGMQAGHAVVITGIDDEAGLVYINDPGFPDGAGVAITISDFEDAWEDSDNTMIEITSADSSGSSDEGGFMDFLMVPLQFIVQE